MRASLPNYRLMVRLKCELLPVICPNRSSSTATKHMGVSLLKLKACMFSLIFSTFS
jgi:hypothetical protein